MTGNKIYVGNLAYGATEQDLREALAAYGTITEAKVITDRETGRSKGFGFVTFEQSTSANSAVEGMNEQPIAGRPVRVSIAEDRPRRPREAGYSSDRRQSYRDNNSY